MTADPQRLLITGVSGFVGQSIVSALGTHSEFSLRGTGRSTASYVVSDYHQADLAPNTNWEPIVSGVDVVIHCAARVHIMDDKVSDPLAEFRIVNVAGTLNLAMRAVEAGVSRFIFISSIKVNGEGTTHGLRYRENDVSMPEDAYGVSKCEAETALLELAKTSNMEVVIIRPPLVYGPGVNGNFLSLLKLANTGFPLPLGAIHNQRSMVYVGNLVDLIIRCIDHPAAANQVFLVSDNRDLSTTELLRMIRADMNLPARLLPVPSALLRLLGRLTGKGQVIERLCDSLQVDVSKARKLLEWEPPFSVEEGMREMVGHFLSTSKDRS